MRSDSPRRAAGKIYQHYPGIAYVIGIFQELFYYLRSALSYAQGAESSVSGMAVRSQYHPSAARHHLPGILMYDCLIGRDIYAAVLYRS